MPHLNCFRTTADDIRSAGLGTCGWRAKEKRSRDPLSLNKFSPDNRTHPARRTPKTTLLDCCRWRQSMPATQEKISLALQANSRRASNLALRAAACVQSCNAAAQIFKLNIFKSCCTNHANQRFLIWERPNRFWQVFIGASRTAEPSPDHWQQS